MDNLLGKLEKWLPLNASIHLNEGGEIKEVRECPKIIVNDMSSPFLQFRFRALMQYASTYYVRLKYLKPQVVSAITGMYPDVPIVTIAESNLMDSSRECIIVGVVYKEMKMKPGVLKEIKKAMDIDTPMDFISSDDSIVLEDESARISIVINDKEAVNINQIVSGVVVAVRGVSHQRFGFYATGIHYAGVPSRKVSNVVESCIPSLLAIDTVGYEPQLVAFVSNLKISSVKDGGYRRLNLLIDFFSGLTNLAHVSGRIGHLFVVGNGVGSLGHQTTSIDPTNLAKYTTKESDENSLVSFEEADLYYASLASSVPLSLISGDDDPTSYALPQLPIPIRMFRTAGKKANFSTSPNPCCYDLSTSSGYDTRVLCMGSQSVNDIMRYTTFQNPIDALLYCMEIRHLAPTAPDTLMTVPFDEHDFLCLPTPTMDVNKGTDKVFPDVFVVGGVTKSEWSHSGGSIGICVGDYSVSGEVVLLDVQSRDITKITLG